jgi:hypothetical protein
MEQDREKGTREIESVGKKQDVAMIYFDTSPRKTLIIVM